MDREKLLQEYLGDKYEKALKSNFSPLAFLFKTQCFAYKKMIGYAVISFLVNCIFAFYFVFVLMYAKEPDYLIKLAIAAFICANLSFSLSFGSIYRSKFNKEVDLIINNSTLDDDNKLKTAKKKGKNSIVLLILFAIIEIALIVFTVMYYKDYTAKASSGNNVDVNVEDEYFDDEIDNEEEQDEEIEESDEEKTEDKDVDKDTDKDSDKDESNKQEVEKKEEPEKKKTKNKKFVGMILFKNQKASEIFDLNIPMQLKDKVKVGFDYVASFEKIGNKTINEVDVLTLNYGILDKFYEPEDLYNQMVAYFKDKGLEDNDIIEKDDLTWYKVIIKKDELVTDYYLFVGDNKDENILLYSFESTYNPEKYTDNRNNKTQNEEKTNLDRMKALIEETISSVKIK